MEWNYAHAVLVFLVLLGVLGIVVILSGARVRGYAAAQKYWDLQLQIFALRTGFIEACTLIREVRDDENGNPEMRERAERFIGDLVLRN